MEGSCCLLTALKRSSRFDEETAHRAHIPRVLIQMNSGNLSRAPRSSSPRESPTSRDRHPTARQTLEIRFDDPEPTYSHQPTLGVPHTALGENLALAVSAAGVGGRQRSPPTHDAGRPGSIARSANARHPPPLNRKPGDKSTHAQARGCARSWAILWRVDQDAEPERANAESR